MKKLTINCLATTALTLLALAFIASMYQARFLFVTSVYQAFCANLAIHIGLTLIQKLESKYFMVEFLWEIGYTLIVLVLCGFLFDWYSSTPLWIVIIMGFGIYLVGCGFGIMKINDDLAHINSALKKRVELNDAD